MSRPKLLDLFCGAGGAAVGYHRAGFDVVGVDIKPQPRYPFEFHEADALTFPLDGFDAIHASPPCTDHSTVGVPFPDQRGETAWMLAATVERLRSAAMPWVVENVVSPSTRREMPGAVTICGRSLGSRRLRRHRLFLVSFPILVSPCACDNTQPIGIYGDLSRNDRPIRNTRDGYVRMRAGVETARELLGCPWMEAAELTQAIPPVYTEHIGGFLLDHLRQAA